MDEEAAEEGVAPDSHIDLTKAEAEFDGVDSTVEAEFEAAAVGAAAGAGSNRAAARRAGARSGVTEKKGVATRARDTEEGRDNPFSRLGRFVREVIAELRKVIWPSQKQMVTYTIVVITFLIFMVALVAGLDLLFHFGVKEIFG
ncbi:preprotein translocase subunit SecE [Nakamurella antarctica]|uniref:Protein translocase subunit SecE n=1 Tax=Nakamurella antarctica TaxID=1902245 RepID=A0A3G8ZS40_9ACTN|nr:preprotein translocase subunit SecE [Nakamurella antarctica]